MAARPKSLDEAKSAHEKACKNHQAALEVLDAAIESKTYGAAVTAWKECHTATLLLKEATNHLYSHLGELKPKKADKLKPGGKLDNAPEGKQVDKRADKKRSNRAAKAGRRAAETERTEARTETASDEPTDSGDDKDDP